MASITIRNLDDSLKRRLRVRAAQHGRCVVTYQCSGGSGSTGTGTRGWAYVMLPGGGSRRPKLGRADVLEGRRLSVTLSRHRAGR